MGRLGRFLDPLPVRRIIMPPARSTQRPSFSRGRAFFAFNGT